MFRRLLFASLFLALPTLGLAADPAKARQKLYVTNSQGDDVTVIDTATNKAVGRIEVGPHPHGIATPASQDVVYVTIEGRGRDKPGELLWIDPQTDKVTRRMDIGPEPNQLAVTPDGKFAYVPVNDGHYEVIDLEKAKIVERIFVGSGSRPHNTLCSADGKHVYLAPMGTPKKVFVVDTSTHKVVAEIPLSNVVRPIALSPDEKRLYANVDGLVGIEVADVAERKMIQRVPAELTAEQKKVASRSHGIGVRPDGKEVWTCDVEHFQVQVFDVTGGKPKQSHTIPIGSQVYWLTFRPDGKVCYVSARGASAVAAVDTATKEVVARITVGKEPKRLLVVTLAEKK
ncbi:MAG TPA: YncE family protein [Gemmataceae bacterium]|nr:YncE family protein [Gemmataceae bacterium]